MKVAVIGATGTIGTPIVAGLRARGAEVVPVSRSTGVDVVTGAGLRAALTGVDVVIDASKVTTGNQPADGHRAVLAAARHLVEACRTDGVGRIVLVSITNIEKPAFDAFPFYVSKRAVEELLRASGVPTTIVRSAQWFEFADTPTAVTPFPDRVEVQDWYMQAVAVEAVAAIIVREAVASTPAAEVAVAGPAPVHLPEVVAGLLAVRGDPRPVRTVPAVLPGFSDGALLAPSGAELVGPDLAGWIATRR
ncbi:SDR family oxidoreductase [Raineyella sp.]|nr:NAD(P)H-binding protein [Raineyella sp.]MEA5155828.1 NAD(P)H-binding protein [Raineyella sp.]